MATTKKTPDPKPVSTSPPPGGGFAVVRGVVKFTAILVGFGVTTLCLMAVVGLFTGNGYARVLTALAVGLALPLFIADRLLPEDPTKAKGLVSDIVSLFWLGFAIVFVVAANASTKPMLVREGDRLVADGFTVLGRVTYILAGVNATIPEPAPAPVIDADAGVDAGSVADGGSGASAVTDTDTDAGAGAATDAGASTDAGAATDAGSGAKSISSEKSPAELFKLLAPSVVTIFVKSNSPGLPSMEGGGTGFLIDDRGTIATNHHVIESVSQIRIKFQNGAVFESIELLVDDSSADLALLRIDLEHPSDAGPNKVEAPAVVLGDSDAVVVGERAISIGNPLGLEHTLTDGLISSRRIYEGRAWIQMSVPVSPGNSGGPLFNMRGEVIGVTTAQIGGGFARAQNLNLAVPVNDLKKLIRAEYPQRRKFGESSSSQW